MIFNSFQFLFLFLPVTLLGFYFLGRTSQKGAAIWLLLASFFFYCSWDYRFLPILLLSMGGNYYACRQILAAQPSRKKSWLIAAVVFNLVLLGYFKYVNFFIATHQRYRLAGYRAVNDHPSHRHFLFHLHPDFDSG